MHPVAIPNGGVSDMILNGHLDDWTVEDLLQIMRITAKTGSLHIVSAPSAAIHFKDGRVCGIDLVHSHDLAEADPGVATNVMAERLRMILPLRTGTFDIGDLTRTSDNAVEVPDLLEAVEKLVALERAALGDDVSEDTALKLRLRLDPVTLEPDTWLAIVDLVGTFSLERLMAKVGRSEAVQLLALLRREDLFERTDEPLQNVEPAVGSLRTPDESPLGAESTPQPVNGGSGGPTPLPEPLVGHVLQDIGRLRKRMSPA